MKKRSEFSEETVMRNRKLFNFIRTGIACISVSAACTITGLAGHWMANETGYWYVHDDGTYPQNAWEWIDNDGDGIYLCYAFDERGYLYTNTVTPDGYVVGPDGSWYSGIVPMTRAFIHGASIVPTSMGTNVNTANDSYVYSADGMQLITQRYSTPKKKGSGSSDDTSTSTSTKSSKSSSSSNSKSSKSTISTGVSSSEIVTTIYKTAKSNTGSGSSASDDASANAGSSTSSTYSEPDVNNTSNDSFGPGGNIPKNYSSQTVSPTADTREYAPKSNVIEREGYEDEDQSDDEEEE